MCDNARSKNPNVNQNPQNAETNVEEASKATKSDQLSIIPKIPLMVSTNVKLENQGPSNVTEELNVIHPEQFNTIISSEDAFIGKILRPSQNSLASGISRPSGISLCPTSGISRPSSGMSVNGFRNFLRQNFPSNLTIQTDNSLLWTTASFPHDQYVPTRSFIDKATQFVVQEVPSHSTDGSLDEVFSRHTSQSVHISPSIVPPRPIQGDPPLQGAPPSYSAVMRIGSTFNPRRLFGIGRRSQIEPSPPFISRSPPPTYAEAQGHFYRPVAVVDSDLMWGPDPMPASCPRCGAYVVTSIQSERSNLTHFAAFGLCLCGCWPCCLLPYCMNSCKNTYHYCPNCSTFLGMYRPW